MSTVAAQGRSSRPLVTGRSFLLVVPDTRVTQLRWDRASAKPGAACELLVDGKGLAALEARVERCDERGVWEEIAAVALAAAEDGASARASWTVPLPPPPALPAGCFLSAHWGQGEAAPGAEVTLHALPHGLGEGAWVGIIVERAGEDGEFVPVERWQTSVEQGSVMARWQVKPVPRGLPQGLIASVRPEDVELAPGQTAWVSIDASGLDGACLQVFLERQDDEGRWIEAGQATSQVNSGRARAGIALPRR